jgi:hypothetical protein
VAPAIERVYRNSQHLGQIRDRHESLAHIERHDHHLCSIRDQHGHSGWCRWQPTRTSDGPIDERLVTFTRAAEMITRSIQAGPPRRISRDEREPVDGPRPSCGLFCRHGPLRTWGAARRSVLDRSGHHAAPTCPRGYLSALGHVGFPTEDDVAEAVGSGLRCVLYDPYRREQADGSVEQAPLAALPDGPEFRASSPARASGPRPPPCWLRATRAEPAPLPQPSYSRPCLAA